MSVRVYHNDLYQGVAEAAAEGLQQTLARKEERRRPKTMEASVDNFEQPPPSVYRARTQTLPSARERLNTTGRLTKRQEKAKNHRLQKYRDEAERQTQEGLRRVKEKTVRRKEAKERRFQQMLADLDNEVAFKEEIDEYLENKDASVRRNKQQLYKDWCKKVFNPIQRDIQGQLDSESTSALEKRRRQAFAEYVDTCNRKEGVFRDIIIEHDYDPLKNRDKYKKYNRRKYDSIDPIHRDVTQIQKEAALISEIDPTVVQINPQARESLDILLWDKLDSTPYARYADRSTEVRHKREVIGAKPSNYSRVELDHYHINKDMKLMKSQYFPSSKNIPKHTPRSDNLLYHHNQPYVEKFVFSDWVGLMKK